MTDIAGWEVVAEQRIRTAQAEGRFDNLPGFGMPIPGLDRPDPNWWIKQKLKSEGLSVLPTCLEAKLARERFFDQLHRIPTERALRERAAVLNEQIHRASLCAMPGPPIPLEPVDVESTVAEWRRTREAA